MVLGYNHNLQYKGETYHVQTEDSGVANPHVITLLYRGGVILSSKKTSYSDVLGMEKLEVFVEEMMKEQHKDMMRRLKSGEFDDKIVSAKPQSVESNEISTPATEWDPVSELFGSSARSASNDDISMLFKISEQASSEQAVVQPSAAPAPDPVSGLFGASAGDRHASKGDISVLFEIPAPVLEQVAVQTPVTPQSDTSKKAANLVDSVLSFFGSHEKK